MTEPTPSPRTACLVNPRAANSRWTRRKLLRLYLEKRLPGEIYDDLGDMRTTVEKVAAAVRSCDIVVAMGGDGTVADTLQGLFEAGAQDRVAFGVIPFGSGNAFRKTFDIPVNPLRAIDRLAEGEARPIDLMEVEGRLAAFSSIGATALVTGEKLQGRIQGLWGHVLAGRRLFNSPRDEKVLELYDGRDDDGPFDARTVTSNFFDCTVMKTNYFGYGWRIAPRAVVDDGYLDITLFEMGPLKYSFLFPLIYLGLWQRRMRHFKARRVVISGHALPLQFNGEYLGERDRLEFRVLPRAVRMVTPATRRGRKYFLKPTA
ncbi:MAG TPA: diacylglycerol kinase family protein [Candidatus Aminicenantes bacterium]|nr:diacylglycerol kinase family protein [Candidatus Aminicenantes bacterium]HRY64658.1 diacylglycerol kinase family protein [Candidatus Aminicenantes bacterium]HRZ71571.1 diacylglycerol kinase family protein [Candidatus Aminicenantes bacterium]